MLTPKYGHQNVDTKIYTPKYGHQNVMLTSKCCPKYGHQNVDQNRDTKMLTKI
jgi:hypothetical protein